MWHYQKLQVAHVDKHYREHRGVLIKKHRSIFGKYVFILEEHGRKWKIYVGKGIFNHTQLNSELFIGELHGKLINIRPIAVER